MSRLMFAMILDKCSNFASACLEDSTEAIIPAGRLDSDTSRAPRRTQLRGYASRAPSIFGRARGLKDFCADFNDTAICNSEMARGRQRQVEDATTNERAAIGNANLD